MASAMLAPLPDPPPARGSWADAPPRREWPALVALQQDYAGRDPLWDIVYSKRTIVYFWCRRFARDHLYEWEDWLQESLFAAYQAVQTYPADTDVPFNLWISRAVHRWLSRIWQERLRTIKDHEIGYPPEPGEDTDGIFGATDFGPFAGTWVRPCDIKDCVERLRPTLRATILWVYWLDYSAQECGRRLGLSEQSGVRLHQEALRDLRHMLDIPEPEQEPKPPVRATDETCAHGHPWTAHSLRITPKGKQVCKICSAESSRRRRAAGRRSAVLAPARGFAHRPPKHL